MWYTALLMGITGSLHCVAMCSPLVIASTGPSGPISKKRIFYNAGRIFVYSIQGALVAGLGSMLHLAGVQSWVSMVIGATLIVFGIAGITHLKMGPLTSILQYLNLWFKKALSHFLSLQSIGSTVIMGMLNGLLPCGLTYFALAYCITLGDAASGFLFMALFGVGTLPVMLGFTGTMAWVLRKINFSPRRLTTMIMIAAGTMLIARSVAFPEVQPKEAMTICR